MPDSDASPQPPAATPAPLQSLQPILLPLPPPELASDRILQLLHADAQPGGPQDAPRGRNLLAAQPASAEPDALMPDLDMLVVHLKAASLVPPGAALPSAPGCRFVSTANHHLA